MWKLESARLVATLTRTVHDVALAEEMAQEALVAALEQWPAAGVPANPGAWLTTVARRRALDHLRRTRRLEVADDDGAAAPDPQDPDSGDVLRLMFLSCHPALPAPQRTALTLRLLAGLSVAEIARAFLADEVTVSRRIAEAKRTLAERGALDLPGDDGGERLASVLEVVYLLFTEGYAATAGDDLLRPELCGEALRLGRMLAQRLPGVAEVHGLLALMELQASRQAARTGPDGEAVPLHEQDRGRWDPLHVRRGLTALLAARGAGPPGPYVLQAAIAACHTSGGDPDWARIAALYAALERLAPSPVVTLNRAVALGRASGADAGLALADPLLADPRLRDYHLLPAVRADLLERAGRPAEARAEFLRAAGLAANGAERTVLARRASRLPVIVPAGPVLGDAVDAFLAGLAPATARSYAQTWTRLRRDLGDATPLETLTAERVARVAATAWSGVAARTWNRHRAAVGTFSGWAGLDDLAAGLARRAPRASDVTSLALDAREATSSEGVAGLCADERWPLRERALWSLLHESRAAITAVLALDVGDLDLDDRRAGRIRWGARTARLLAALLDGRERGPVFLSERRPAPARAPAVADLCPVTGRRRLSYERAEYLCKRATGRTLFALRARE